MVKCSNCGLDVAEDMENCPNCGNNLNKSAVQNVVDQTNKCNNCGSDLPENTLFCSVCGTKVDNVKKDVVESKICPNCGVKIEEGITFCQECGANIFTGERNKYKSAQSQSFSDKINLNLLIKPSIVALVVALIGLAIGLSWLSFIIAIILSAGFFGASVDNDANAIIFGLIVGLILGLLENPLVEFMYGVFVAGFYDGFFGGHLVIIVILGIVMAYVSNVYLKETIVNMTDNFKGIL